jgi:LysR family transcriptional regulator, benzoate and cis,cis-muconate-responsive activator of ben and cat genes
MELRHLRYFVAVAEEENVSRAALKLHVSQPGLSRQIRDLEDEIGFQLFERSAKSLRLTDAGKTFLPEAKAVLQRADDAVKKARAAISGTHGEIHVGYAPSLTVQILPPTLRGFQGKFPNVRVALHDLSTEEMLTQLRNGKLQVALMVRLDRKTLRGLDFQELASYPIRVAVAPKHPFAKLKSVTLAQIAREPIIAYSREDYPEYHAMLGKIFATTGRSPRIAEEHDGITGIVLAVESGGGFALVPSCVECMVGPRLKLIPLSTPVPEVPVIAAWKKATLSEPVKQFIATAAEKGGDAATQIRGLTDGKMSAK